MTVWVLFWDSHDSRGVIGVYATFHAATKDWEFYRSNDNALRNRIGEYILDVWIDDDWSEAIKEYEVI